MASERVERVRAKSLALSAKVRRRAFLMLWRTELLEDWLRGVQEGCALSDGLVDDLASVPLRL